LVAHEGHFVGIHHYRGLRGLAPTTALAVEPGPRAASTEVNVGIVVESLDAAISFFGLLRKRSQPAFRAISVEGNVEAEKAA
jgi:hypothetical protein